MESRLIYESSKSYLHKVNWIKSINADSEWIHFINNNSLNLDLVNEFINNHFKISKLYFVSGRNNSIEFDRSMIKQKLDELPKLSSFLLWSEDFISVMEFNKIGIMRSGVASR